ncbi:MAG: PH domain-containing protein [Thermodesulfobacteriota bacterium]
MEQKTILPSTEDRLTLRPSWRSYFVFYAAILIFGIGPAINPEAGISRPLGLLIAVILAGFVWFRRKAAYYRITNREIKKETGLGRRIKAQSLPLEEVAEVEVRRGITHRFLGLGHLGIHSKSKTHPDLWWYGVEDPFSVKKKIESFLPRS